MQIVILAGGKAIRLYPLTKHIPKSMIQILGKPFLSYQLDLLKINKITDVVLCLGTFSNQIIDYFGNGKRDKISIKYSVEEPDSLLGTAGALKKAEKILDDEFFVMYGDSYLPINFEMIFQEFKKSGKSALMTVYKNNNQFDKSNVDINDNIVIVYDKSDNSHNLKYIDYGLLVLKKSVLDIIPSNEFINLDYLICNLIEKKELVSLEVNQRFYEIGTISGVNDFENYIKSKM